MYKYATKKIKLYIQIIKNYYALFTLQLLLVISLLLRNKF